jgi:hypothetical protein
MALSLIGADYVLRIIVLSRSGDVSGPGGFISVLLQGVITAMWWTGLYRRLNWLRWLTVASAILGIALLPWVWGMIHRQQNIAIQMLKYALFDSGALLLCLPQASRWYTHKTAG